MDFIGQWSWVVLSEILLLNLILSGDNAVLIALAASGLPPADRSRAIMYGMVLAVVLRIILSLAAVYLLEIPGILLVGGLLLLWIAWGFWKELRHKREAGHQEGAAEPGNKTMAMALRQIVIADVSMSLDNVLAVAGAAHGNLPMLAVGLVVSIILMGVAASLIAQLLDRFPAIAYVGIALIVWVGIDMIYEDVHRAFAGAPQHAEWQAPSSRPSGG